MDDIPNVKSLWLHCLLHLLQLLTQLGDDISQNLELQLGLWSKKIVRNSAMSSDLAFMVVFWMCNSDSRR